jgi:hypothetical protein
MSPLLLLKRQYLQQVRAGTKTATIRPWKTTTLQPGDRLVFSGGVRAIITRVVRCTVATVSLADCQADGFTSARAFRRAMRAIYPQLAPDAPCVVLHFRLARRP